MEKFAESNMVNEQEQTKSTEESHSVQVQDQISMPKKEEVTNTEEQEQEDVHTNRRMETDSVSEQQEVKVSRKNVKFALTLDNSQVPMVENDAQQTMPQIKAAESRSNSVNFLDYMRSKTYADAIEDITRAVNKRLRPPQHLKTKSVNRHQTSRQSPQIPHDRPLTPPHPDDVWDLTWVNDDISTDDSCHPKPTKKSRKEDK